MKSGTGDPVWHSGLSISRIVVIAALELEAAILRRVFGAGEFSVFVSGPGLERAGAAAMRAVESGAEGLISWGMSGGLSRAAVTGSIILPDRVLSTDGYWPTDPDWRARLAAALAPDLPMLQSPLFSAAAALTRPEDKATLAAATGAVAVDMESAAIARVAADAGLPCLILRAVADGPDDGLPSDVEKLVTEDGRTCPRGLIRMLLAPVQLGALFRLAGQSRIARRMLRLVATRLSEQAA